MPVVELFLLKANPECSKILVDEPETPEDGFSFDDYNPDPLAYDNDLLPALPVYAKNILPIELSITKNWCQYIIVPFNFRESDIWQPPRLS